MGNFKSTLDNFQVIPRKLIFDNTISDRARFVYCYMASKPDGWDFYLIPMAKEIGYSVETLRKYINELIESGWLDKKEQKNDGRFGAVEYTLLNKKENDEMCEKTEYENFRHGEMPTQYNIDNIENRDSNTDEEKEKDKSFSKKAKFSLDLSAVGEHMKDAVNTWLAYKKEKGKSYKQIGFNAFYKKLVQLSGNNSVNAMKIIEQSMANNYDGIFPLKKEMNQSYNNFQVGVVLRKDNMDYSKDNWED